MPLCFGPCHPAFRSVLGLILLLLIPACSIWPASGSRSSAGAPPVKTSSAPASSGGYYLDDGPGDRTPADLDSIPDALPRVEPLHKSASRPYTVLGKQYVPQTRIQHFRQDGIASWYGRKFHGKKTSTGEIYDMYAMTAAHPTLALPSYARVSNPANGKSVVVRVNDRGPFHKERIMDLSYTAAHKLGYIQNGSGRVIVESLVPGTPRFEAIVRQGERNAPSSFAHSAQPPDHKGMDTLALQLAAGEHASVAEEPVITSSMKHGIFLQLGAFSQAENAEGLKNRLIGELEERSGTLFIYRAGNLYRLQSGPYPDRASAEAIATYIQERLGYAPALVFR
jgi:rare lipoprotein A